MKIITTSHQNTLIDILESPPINEGLEPPLRDGKKSVANYQREMTVDNPYPLNFDDVSL